MTLCVWGEGAVTVTRLEKRDFASAVLILSLDTAVGPKAFGHVVGVKAGMPRIKTRPSA